MSLGPVNQQCVWSTPPSALWTGIFYLKILSLALKIQDNCWLISQEIFLVIFWLDWPRLMTGRKKGTHFAHAMNKALNDYWDNNSIFSNYWICLHHVHSLVKVGSYFSPSEMWNNNQVSILARTLSPSLTRFFFPSIYCGWNKWSSSILNISEIMFVRKYNNACLCWYFFCFLTKTFPVFKLQDFFLLLWFLVFNFIN